jgi:hypothetical protein
MAKTVIIASPDAVVSFTLAPATSVSFECQVTNAAVSMAANPITVPATGCEGATTRQGAPTYGLHVEWLQDWGNAESLSQFLWDNALEDATFELSVGVDPIPVASGTCQLVPGEYGGDFANPLTATADMSVSGKPTIAPGAARAAAAGGESADVEAA